VPSDFLYILVWKAPRRINAQGEAAHNAFSCIREKGVEGIKDTSEEAFQLAEKNNVEDSVKKLSDLHGVDTRVASAILTFYDAKRFGMMDRLTWRVLYNEKKETFEAQDYLKYLKDIRELAEKCNTTPRIIDLGLWHMGWPLAHSS
jgi:thermostable 8-oxoguanine DNA glycosylase